jgi:hypothetical protein
MICFFLRKFHLVSLTVQKTFLQFLFLDYLLDFQFPFYRLGLYLEQDTVVLVRLLHRKEMYRYFP